MSKQVIELAERLKKQAREGVMQFWLDHGIDEEYGGYWTDLERDGSRYGEGTKWVIVQMRTVYSMCLAYQFFGEQVFLDQAAQGAAFFRAHFRDEANGGWYQAVSRDGQSVVDPTKQPYGQSFISYALAEYARLSGDEGALDDAIDAHHTVMTRCWDRVNGGLPNMFSPDWQLLNGLKRVDTHMHTMEGVSALYHATGDARYLHRLNLLADTILAPIGKGGCYDVEYGCTHEWFLANWTEALWMTHGATNFGHVTEAGWFIAKLAAYTGNERQFALAKGLIDWANTHGWDSKRGGQFNYGFSTGEITDDKKVWWNQGEVMGALAFLYRMTGDKAYFARLEEHVAFIEHDLWDQEYGEWYPMLNADGTVHKGPRGLADRKGSPHKCPYHVIQGLYHAYRDLMRAAGQEKVADPKQWGDFCL